MLGEQLPSSDAKVFEVIVLLNETDTTLRPSMTTVTQIKTNTYSDVVYVPLEAVHSSIRYPMFFRLERISGRL
jgi:hypothetical protein